MPPLPDDAYVVRGGLNQLELLRIGSGITTDDKGHLRGVSVNCAAGKSVSELAAGLRNSKVCVTTVGAIRAMGGIIESKPTQYNPDHCEVAGVSAEVLHQLLMPPIVNPSQVR